MTSLILLHVEAILARLRDHKVDPREHSNWEHSPGLPDATDMAFLKSLFTFLHDLGESEQGMPGSHILCKCNSQHVKGLSALNDSLASHQQLIFLHQAARPLS